jgi:hypothetical protein
MDVDEPAGGLASRGSGQGEDSEELEIDDYEEDAAMTDASASTGDETAVATSKEKQRNKCRNDLLTPSGMLEKLKEKCTLADSQGKTIKYLRQRISKLQGELHATSTPSMDRAATKQAQQERRDLENLRRISERMVQQGFSVDTFSKFLEALGAEEPLISPGSCTFHYTACTGENAFAKTINGFRFSKPLHQLGLYCASQTSGHACWEGARGQGAQGSGAHVKVTPEVLQLFNLLLPSTQSLDAYGVTLVDGCNITVGVFVSAMERAVESLEAPLRWSMDGTKCKGSPEYNKNKFGHGDICEVINPDKEELEEMYTSCYDLIMKIDFEKDPEGSRDALLTIAKFLEDNMHFLNEKQDFINARITKKTKIQVKKGQEQVSNCMLCNACSEF